MERTIELRVEIDKDDNYKVVSYEPESGINCIVDAGTLSQLDDDTTHEFELKVGTEVLSWIECWMSMEDEE